MRECVSNSNFIEFAFVALVALQATFFTAFGVLYSVYSMHKSTVDNVNNRYPPLIVKDLKVLCWVLAVGIVVATALAVVCLYYTELTQTVEHVIRIGLSAIMVGLSLATLYVATTMNSPKSST